MNSDVEGDAPRTLFVIDRFGRPDLAGGRPALAAWTDRIFELSLVPDVQLQLSGLAAQADADLVAKAFAEYQEHGARYSASSSAWVALKRNVKVRLLPRTVLADSRAAARGLLR